MGQTNSLPEGHIETLCGSDKGLVDGPALEAKFNWPEGIVRHPNGGIIVADTYNHAIRLYSPEGEVTTICGDGTPGDSDGEAKTAKFRYPSGILLDSKNNLLICDTFNHKIRLLSSDFSTVTTLTGIGEMGYKDGVVAGSAFSLPSSLAMDSSGNIYVADTKNHRIRMITSDYYYVKTVAGSGQPGRLDGNSLEAELNCPKGLAFDNDEQLLVADTWNHCIRRLSIDFSSITTIAGSGTKPSFKDGPSPSCQFSFPSGIALDPQGNIFVSDCKNYRIRRVDKEKNYVSTVAGWTSSKHREGGFVDGPLEKALIGYPHGLLIENDSVIFSDCSNHRIRKITFDVLNNNVHHK